MPQQFSNFPRLETVFLNHNEILSLDGALSGCRALKRIDLESNQIHTVSKEYTKDIDTQTQTTDNISSLSITPYNIYCIY